MAVSEYVKRMLSEQGIKVSGVIPNCIDTKKFNLKKTSRNNKGLYVGSANYWAKGLDIINELVESYDLDIEYASSQEVPNLSAKYIGAVKYEDMPKLYSKYSYMILPSRFEGMSMAVWESMSSGTPVIISNVGASYEISSTFPELVCSTFNVKEYKNSIDYVIQNWPDLSKKSHLYIQSNYSIETYLEHWRLILEEH